MNINNSTKLSDILIRYPFLKKQLPSINPKFNAINSPMAKIMLKKTTIAEMSKKSGMSEKDLITELNKLINLHN